MPFEFVTFFTVTIYGRNFQRIKLAVAGSICPRKLAVTRIKESIENAYRSIRARLSFPLKMWFFYTLLSGLENICFFFVSSIFSFFIFLFTSLCEISGVYGQHLSGLRTRVLSMYSRTKRPTDQSLRAVLSPAWWKSTVPVCFLFYLVIS